MKSKALDSRLRGSDEQLSTGSNTPKTGDKPTAIVIETGSARAEKLPPLGLENEDAPIYGFKQDIAQRVSQDYQVIAGTVITGQRQAKGVADSFTKDLTGYLTANVPQSVAVAFVNFPDLDPDGTSNPPEDPMGVMRRKVYDHCDYRTWQCPDGRPGCADPDPAAYRFCRDPSNPPKPVEAPGTHYEKSSAAHGCANPPRIVTLGFGGSMTTGRSDFTFEQKDGCPLGGHGTPLPCFDTRITGKITMNAVQVESATCGGSFWIGGSQINYPRQDVAMQVCCRWHWEPDYPATP